MVKNFLQLLENLVSIPSPSGEEGKASAFLVQWMTQNGLQARVDEAGNAVGQKGSGPKEIILLGHIDTFSGNPPVRREGDLLYGRGSVDAKGPLCTFAAAASVVTVPDGWRLTVVGAVEEESATSKGARHLLSQRTSAPPRYCIIGEPSRWDRMTLGYRSRLLLHLTLRVPFSHSAGQGELPAEQGVNLWRAIGAYAAQVNESRQGAFNRLDVSLRAINSRDEGAFGEVDMSLGFRLPVGLSPLDLEADLREMIAAEIGDGQIFLGFSGGELAHRAKKSTPLVRAFLKAIRANEGRPRFVVKTGTSDMNVVAPVWQCPILAYGPGDSSLDHTPHEHIDLNEYLRAIEVLKAALVELMSEV